MPTRSFPEFVPGQRITADQLNRIGELLENYGRHRGTDASNSIGVDFTPGSVSILDNLPRFITIQITGGSSPYSWEQLLETTGGATVVPADGLSGTTTQLPFYEVTGNTSLASGQICLAWLALGSGNTPEYRGIAADLGSGGPIWASSIQTASFTATGSTSQFTAYYCNATAAITATVYTLPANEPVLIFNTSVYPVTINGDVYGTNQPTANILGQNQWILFYNDSNLTAGWTISTNIHDGETVLIGSFTQPAVGSSVTIWDYPTVNLVAQQTWLRPGMIVMLYTQSSGTTDFYEVAVDVSGVITFVNLGYTFAGYYSPTPPGSTIPAGIVIILTGLMLPQQAVTIAIGTTPVTGGTVNDILTVGSGGFLGQISPASLVEITIGSTVINGGTNGDILTDSSGTVGNSSLAALLTALGGITATNWDGSTFVDGLLTATGTGPSIPTLDAASYVTLSANVDLSGSIGSWVSLGVSITVTNAGTYLIDADFWAAITVQTVTPNQTGYVAGAIYINGTINSDTLTEVVDSNWSFLHCSDTSHCSIVLTLTAGSTIALYGKCGVTGGGTLTVFAALMQSNSTEGKTRLRVAPGAI